LGAIFFPKILPFFPSRKNSQTPRGFFLLWANQEALAAFQRASFFGLRFIPVFWKPDFRKFAWVREMFSGYILHREEWGPLFGLGISQKGFIGEWWPFRPLFGHNFGFSPKCPNESSCGPNVFFSPRNVRAGIFGRYYCL